MGKNSGIFRLKLKASYTVESSVIIPCCLALIFLLIFTSFYMHDLVVSNAAAIETAYLKKEEAPVQPENFTLSEVSFSDDIGYFYRTVSWDKSYRLPLASFISLVTDYTSVNMGGQAKRQLWSTGRIIRFVSMDGEKVKADEEGV